MKTLQIAFCVVIMACAMYFPVTDYVESSEKDKNIMACLPHHPGRGRTTVHVICHELYEKGVRYAEFK